MRGIRAHLRLAVVIAVVLLLAATVAVVRGLGPRGALGTDETSPGGARAVATLLAAHGVRVIAADSAAAAAAALGRVPATTATLLVTSGGIGSARLTALWNARPAHVVVVDPPAGALASITGLVSADPRSRSAPATVSAPGCQLPAAGLAGSVVVTGPVFAIRPPARVATGGLRTGDARAVVTACYPAPSAGGGSSQPGASGAWLVHRIAAGRTLDVLGSAAFLTNGRLADEGDAALALNLLGTATTLVWYRPALADAVDPGSTGRRGGLLALIPGAVWAVLAELAVAALLLAIARGRRLGRLVPEPLPVTVRASETARGRARLYRRTRARPAALATLREAALVDLTSRLGLPAGTPPTVVADAAAARTGWSAGQLRQLLDPGERDQPMTDAALLTAARDLRDLRRVLAAGSNLVTVEETQ